MSRTSYLSFESRDQRKWDRQVYVDRGHEKKENTYKSFTRNTDVWDTISFLGNLWLQKRLQNFKRTRRSAGKQTNKRKLMQFCRKHLRHIPHPGKEHPAAQLTTTKNLLENTIRFQGFEQKLPSLAMLHQSLRLGAFRRCGNFPEPSKEHPRSLKGIFWLQSNY